MEKMLVNHFFLHGEGKFEMKNILSVGMILIFIALNPFSFGETTDRSELDVLSNLFEENGIELEEWSLYTRGEVEQFEDADSFKQGISLLMNQLERFEWVQNGMESEDEHLYVTGTYLHPTLPLEERLSVYSYPSENHSYLMYISYEVNGHGLTNSESSLQNWNSTVQTIFPEQPQIYTMVKGMDTKGYSLDERADHLLSQLSAQKVEELKESHFVSISAYNNNWDSVLMSNHEKMNLQLGLRQEPILGGRTTVTIGTPIITIEY